LQVSNATGQEAPEDDQEVPGDTVMNDTESESDIEEISAGAALSVPVQEVCRFFEKLRFRSSSLLMRIENTTFHTFGFSKSMKSCVLILSDFHKI
jgi:hypothetical protein